MQECSNLTERHDYEFICKGCETGKSGGGVGMYILEDTNYKIREDLYISDPSIEYIFIEVSGYNNSRNTII